MMKKYYTKPLALVSFCLAVIGIVVLAVYLGYQFLDNKAYHRKWEDYDDCGLA